MVLLYTKDGDTCRIRPEEEGELDAAFTTYIESGGTRDKLLTLTTLTGDQLKVACSSISNWMIRSMAGMIASEKFEMAYAARMRQVNPMFGEAR